MVRVDEGGGFLDIFQLRVCTHLQGLLTFFLNI